MNKSEYVKEFRLRKRWTQKELADALKINQQTISYWENGHSVNPMAILLLKEWAERDGMDMPDIEV